MYFVVHYSPIFLSTGLSARFCPRILLHTNSTCPANTINLNHNTEGLKLVYIDLLCTSQKTQGASLRKKVQTFSFVSERHHTSTYCTV